MKKLKPINPIKSLNAFRFLSDLESRRKRFRKGGLFTIPEIYPVNDLARRLHPARQYVRILKIEDHKDAKTFTFGPDTEKGTWELAWFSSGQYVTVFVDIGARQVTRAYSLCSSPRQSLGGRKGIYQITVKECRNGTVSSFILNTWKEGDSVELSAPEGNFDYNPLRDAPTVIGIAGGSGITPFLSFARSIQSGDEDFNLILLYGNRKREMILFKDEFERISQECSRVKVVNVLSEEEAEGYEHGFITAELIQKYAPKDTSYSVFLCGPQGMYAFEDKELLKIGLEKKYIRHEMLGEIHGASRQEGYPASAPAEVNIKVTIKDKVYVARGSSDDTILQILEKNGIAVPSRCRSGECGWCHSLLKSGNVWVPKNIDYRRKADYKYGFIHPCCTFPLSDIEMEIPPAK